jgi:hypothetical protein
MKANSVLFRLDTRNMGTVQRLAHGLTWGVIGALAMWLISTLMHAEKSNLGLTWQEAFLFVMMITIGSLASGWHKK